MSVRQVASANPAMLQWARSEKGLELDAAAHKAHIRPEKLARFERGEDRPSVPQLRKLAEVYKRPLGVFFLSNTPPTTPGLPDRRTLNSERVATLSSELRMAVRLARYRRELALELFAELGEQPPRVPFAANLSDDPEQLAARVRDWLGATGYPHLSDHRRAYNRWREALETRGVLVFQARTVALEEMRGFALAENPLPVVVTNLADGYPARSFTLLHELTHVLLGQSALCLPPTELEPDDPTETGRIEAFCNRVSGAVLVPREVLEEEIAGDGVPSDEAVQRMARRLGVSREVVFRRLHVLGRVSSDFYRLKRRELQAEFERRPAKPGGRGPSPATLALAVGGRTFTRLVIEAYDEDRITTSEASDYLGVKVPHLARIRHALRTATPYDEEDS
ncbi:MAG: ImmA/IrrE family metallo-endopeptidase [Fimbriimonadaceae bacterium]|nr:ImmA/IrrE family metallo-endopeptidase [Fimbriimonadaceae bacterium]